MQLSFKRRFGIPGQVSHSRCCKHLRSHGSSSTGSLTPTMFLLGALAWPSQGFPSCWPLAVARRLARPRNLQGFCMRANSFEQTRYFRQVKNQLHLALGGLQSKNLANVSTAISENTFL